MAKKRKDAFSSDVTEGSALSNLLTSTVFIPDFEMACIPTTITNVNKILGGGFKTGTINVITGASQSGKSAMAGTLLKSFFKQNPEGYGIYADIEQTTDIDRLEALGVPVDNERFIHYSLSVPLETIQKQLDELCKIKENFKTQHIPTLFILDSMDAAYTEKEEAAENPDKALGTRAKFIKFLFKKNLNRLVRYNICFVIVAHITEHMNMDPYAPYSPKLETLGNMTVGGGKAMEFWPEVFILMRQRKTKKISEFLTEQVGLSSSSYVVEISTLKCKKVPNGIVTHAVFEPSVGFLELPTRIYCMYDDNVFGGTTKKFLGNLPDFKFWIKEIPEFYKTDPIFKEKFDECWDAYLNLKYKHAAKASELISHTGVDATVNIIKDEDVESIVNDVTEDESRTVDFSEDEGDDNSNE